MLNLRDRTNRGPKSIERPMPPPVGGWNAKDAFDQMKETDAVLLENWFPRQSDVVTRGGYSLLCNTGETGKTIKTLAEFKTTTTRKLLAGVNGKLYEVSTGTASSIGTGYSQDLWKWVNFGGKIFLVNGTDTPLDWDGTTLTATAWTGPTSINALSDVAVFKERLFFIEKDTLSFWYGGLKSITGALTKFDLKYTGSFGGTLKSIGLINTDGSGTSPANLIAFYLTSGEVIIYAGSDPGDATNWSRVGTFLLSPLVGSWPTAQYGSDLVCITDGAYVQMTKVMPFGRAEQSDLDLSDKIQLAVSEAMRLYRDNTGWQVLHYPRGRKLIFNVPRSTSAFDQHVMNIDTHAWCKFTGWNFAIFGLYRDNLYGGDTNGKVWLCDSGYSDNSAAIVSDAQTAWNYFGSRDRIKSFTEARIIMAAVSDPGALISFGTDFDISVPTKAVSTGAVATGGVWDVAVWDVDTWGGATQIVKGWQGITGLGYSASMRLRTSLNAQSVSWRSSNIIMKPGGLA